MMTGVELKNIFRKIFVIPTSCLLLIPRISQDLIFDVEAVQSVWGPLYDALITRNQMVWSPFGQSKIISHTMDSTGCLEMYVESE